MSFAVNSNSIIVILFKTKIRIQINVLLFIIRNDYILSVNLSAGHNVFKKYVLDFNIDFVLSLNTFVPFFLFLDLKNNIDIKNKFRFYC